MASESFKVSPTCVAAAVAAAVTVDNNKLSSSWNTLLKYILSLLVQ